MKLLWKIPLLATISFFALSGVVWWALVAPAILSIYSTHGFVKQWPPENPFFPIDGIVIEKVLLDESDHDNFLGDGTTIRIYQVAVDDRVYAVLSNNRVRRSRIWLARPFDDKTTGALGLLMTWASKKKGASYLWQIRYRDDLYVTYDDLQRGSDAAMWLFSPSQKLLIFVQVNT